MKSRKLEIKDTLKLQHTTFVEMEENRKARIEAHRKGAKFFPKQLTVEKLGWTEAQIMALVA